jgi:hypothetical protein
MHKITLEPEGRYQLRLEDRGTEVEDPDLQRRDHAAVLPAPTDLRKVCEHSPWAVLSLKGIEMNNVVSSCGPVSQLITGGR